MNGSVVSRRTLSAAWLPMQHKRLRRRTLLGEVREQSGILATQLSHLLVIIISFVPLMATLLILSSPSRYDGIFRQERLILITFVILGNGAH